MWPAVRKASVKELNTLLKILPSLSLLPWVEVEQQDVLQAARGQIRQTLMSICYCPRRHPHRPDILKSKWVGHLHAQTSLRSALANGPSLAFGRAPQSESSEPQIREILSSWLGSML